MSKITNLLGDQAAFYLEHTCRTIDKSLIHIPSSSTIDDTWISSDRNIRTLSSIQTLLGHGRIRLRCPQIRPQDSFYCQTKSQ